MKYFKILPKSTSEEILFVTLVFLLPFDLMRAIYFIVINILMHLYFIFLCKFIDIYFEAGPIVKQFFAELNFTELVGYLS